MHRQTKRYRTLAGVALWTGSARIFTGYRIDQLGLGAFPYSPREQTKRPDPTQAKQDGDRRLAKDVLRISRFGRGVDARSARTTFESKMITRSPNKAMEPTRPNVTDRAGARSAPFGRAAHLRR